MKKQEKGSFGEWMAKTFSKDEMKDITNHGADCGYHHLTYYSDVVKLHDKFEDEIWDKLYEDAENQGMSILEFVASFNGGKDVGSLSQLKNLLVWYMAEEIARELSEED